MIPEYANTGSIEVRLIEECAELIQALCKVARFGPINGQHDNLAHLLAEAQDLRRLIEEWSTNPTPLPSTQPTIKDKP